VLGARTRVGMVTLVSMGACLGAAAPAALANAVVSASGASITYQATSGDVDAFRLDTAGSPATAIVASFDWQVTTPVGVPIAASGVHCVASTGAWCTVGPGSIATLELGDRDDLVELAARQLNAGHAPAVVVHGGSGTDTVRYLVPATVTLDDQANDGPPGMGDNIGSDVEVLEGSSGDDHLTGSTLPNTLRGNGGNDTIEAVNGAPDVVDCGPGTADHATVEGIDTVMNCESVTTWDADADGVGGPADCDDGDAGIHPGALDVPGDGIDQDCSGTDAPVVPSGPAPGGSGGPTPGSGSPSGGTPPPPAAGALAHARVAAQIATRFAVTRRGTKVVRLKASKIPAGGKVQLGCTGTGCPFETTSATPKKGAVTLTKLFADRRLKPGAVIELRITAPNLGAQVVRFTIRTKKAPKRATG
jgi:putative metal-binding protein/hemolysin type calcium-binding protein